ncbi:FtsK/SpoIIIE domain-containing protein [Dactylosporangium sp. CS-033363]|uniref:FtsK/SpoIIIE domain-containing protein n=1 Tax=Dactylosporangium sp. CS-033363 TaxID=3239935 RepID=UPI003D8C7A94
MWLPITVSIAGREADLHVEAREGATVDQLAAALGAFLGADGRAVLHGPAGPCPPQATLAEAGLRAGAIVSFGPGSSPAPRWDGRSVRVVSGPDAGVSAPLPPGAVLTVGRGEDRGLRLSTVAASERHAVFVGTAGGADVTDEHSSNHTLVGDALLRGGDTRPAPPGTLVRIGDDLLTVHDPGPPRPPAVLIPMPDGTLRLDRQQRYDRPADPGAVTLPEPPPEPSKAATGLGWTAASGLVLGAVAYLVWHNVSFLILSGASTVTLLASTLAGAFGGRRKQRRAGREYAAARAAGLTRLGELAAAERRASLEQAPDLAEVLAVAQRFDGRLWQRRPGHEDFLRLRLGVADLPSAVALTDPAPERDRAAPPTLRGVPVTASLGTAGTVGVAGPPAAARALARSLVLQAAVQSGPADLRIALLARRLPDDAAAGWDFLRWLPHVRGTAALATVAAGEETLAALVDTVRAALAAGGPRWLLVVDGVAEHDVAGLADLLRAGPERGVHVIAVGALPSRCPITVELDQREPRLTVRRPAEPDLSGVLADLASPAIATAAARALAPLADPDARAGAAGLPASVALLDLPGMSADPAAIVQRWRREPRRTAVPLGATGEGPLVVDLVGSGPHALVAGSTGYGKSALLQTLVAALALANRPDELGFILVDFKGGAAFQPFEGLPHVLDMITNLDGPKVMRAIDSLAGEIRRRQQLLSELRIEGLSEYQRKADDGTLPDGAPKSLPRMFVVIDEFSILRDDLPDDILKRLTTVATQGRSLGLHLVIGTQTPRGIVPTEIRPNVNIRVALHLDAEHSTDVVGSPAAEAIAVPGRALLQRGDTAGLTMLQTAFVGGSTRRAAADVRIVRAALAELGRPPELAAASAAKDVNVLAAAIRDAAELEGFTRTQAPWLPPLPDELDLPPSAAGVLSYAREDWVAEREQPVAAWHLESGHLLAAGRPRSGRTALLRALAASVAASRPDELHLYVIDCGGRLADLRDLPHCGAYVTRDELDRGARLLDRLERLVDEPPRRARTVLLIDDFDTWERVFGELNNRAPVDQLTHIFQKGAAAGVHVAMTGTARMLTRHPMLNSAATDRIALSFDQDDYNAVGVPAALRPADPRPGQAIRLTAPYRTMQIAYRLPPAPAHASVQGGPWRIDALPSRLPLADARALPRDRSEVFLGAGGDELTLLGARLSDGPGVFVAGEPGSGKSTALLAAGLDLIARGVPVVVIAPNRTSPLRLLADNVAGVAVALLAPTPTERHVQLALATVPSGPYVVLIDDADRLQGPDVARVLREQVFESGEPGVGALVAADLDAFGGPPHGSILAESGRAGVGLLTGPRQPRAFLFGAVRHLPEAYVGRDIPGRGILLRRREPLPVQVPLVTAADVDALPRREGRMNELLGVVDRLAGPLPVGVDRLRALVAELAPFNAMPQPNADRLLALAPAWTGTATALIAEAG